MPQMRSGAVGNRTRLARYFVNTTIVVCISKTISVLTTLNSCHNGTEAEESNSVSIQNARLNP